MRYSLFSVLALGLSTVVQAGISSPPTGAQWPVGQDQQITWDTTGLTAPVNIHLVPAGAVDITVIIVEIAIGVSNTGSFTWAPDTTISTPNVEIIIVDAKQVIVISEVFEIIIIEVTSTKKLTTTPTKTSTVLKLSTVTKLATVTTQPTLLTTKPSTLVLTQTLVKTVSSVVTTKPLTTTVKALVTTTSIKVTTLTTPVILSTTSKPLNTTSMKLTTTSTKLTTTALGLLATTTSKPMTTSTSIKPLNTSMSSIRVNATAVAATSKATFTGAAAHLASSNTYSLVSGGLLGLIAMVFL